MGPQWPSIAINVCTVHVHIYIYIAPYHLVNRCQVSRTRFAVPRLFIPRTVQAHNGPKVNWIQPRTLEQPKTSAEHDGLVVSFIGQNLREERLHVGPIASDRDVCVNAVRCWAWVAFVDAVAVRATYGFSNTIVPFSRGCQKATDVSSKFMRSKVMPGGRSLHW
jgi:hypothetical protein